MNLRLMVFVLAWAPLVAGAQSATLKSPNVSGNALFLYRNSNFNKEDASEVRNGLDLQEAELSFYSDVDPYSRLTMLFTVAPEYKLNATTDRVEQSWIFEPEELYVDSDHVPGVSLRLGKFKGAFGKHNILHSHAYPFVDAPMVNDTLLGSEGLADVGVSAAALLPVNWFSEFTVQYLRGEDGNGEFNSPTPGDGVGIGHFKNLLDLNDSLTLEAGLSYAHGGNSVGGSTALSGADLTMKWRPVSGGLYHSAILALEYIDRSLGQSGFDTEHGHGAVSWAKYQFAERWAGLVRYENLKMKNSTTLDNALSEKSSYEILFSATEFSSLRLEYDMSHGPRQANGEHDEHKIYLQANFTIGAHPAHSY